MNKLSLFWGDLTDPYFRWSFTADAAASEKAGVLHPLQNRRMLKADLGVMAEMARDAKVELVLSAIDIHVNQITMPNKAVRHLRKAAPFLLEEQVADSIDKLFIAVGERLGNDKIPVRGVNQQYLQELLRIFTQAEIALKSIKVDLDLIDQPKQGLSLLLLADQVLVVEDSGQRWSCNQEDFSWLVQKNIEDSEQDYPVARPLQIISEDSELATLFESQLPAGRFAPQSEIVDSVDDFLAAHVTQGINLLQGEFEVKEQNSPMKIFLLRVASLFGLVLLAQVFYQGSQIYALEVQKNRLDEEKAGLWQQAFPGRKMPDNEDKVLRTYLKDAGGSGEAAFLTLLESSMASLTNLDAVYPTNISFDAAKNELRLDIIAQDLGVLNQYRDALVKAGHQVEQSSATQRGDSYSSRLIINH